MPGPYTGNPLSHLWGSFQAAVNDPEIRSQPGGIQQFVWASVRQDFLSQGESIPAGSFQAVNELLSLAGQQRQASLNLQESENLYQRTGLDQAIIAAQHVASDIDSRAPNAQPAGGEWRIRYEFSVNVAGENVLLRATHIATLDRPQSMSALIDLVDQAAQARAEDYGYEYTGESAVTGITQV